MADYRAQDAAQKNETQDTVSGIVDSIIYQNE